MPDDDPWGPWDQAREAGALPTELARDLSDEEVARLTSEAGAGRESERKLLAAEALRRKTDEEQARNRAALATDAEGEATRRMVNEAANRIHAAERSLERASAAQLPSPPLKAAHEASLLAEEHRAQVEAHMEHRAKHRAAVEALKDTLDRLVGRKR